MFLLPEAEMEWAWGGGQEDAKREGMSYYTEDKVSCVAVGTPLNHSESQFPSQ